MKHAVRKNFKKKLTKPGKPSASDFEMLISSNCLMYSLLLKMAHTYGSSKLRLIDVIVRLNKELEILFSLEAALKKSGSGKTGKAGKKR